MPLWGVIHHRYNLEQRGSFIPSELPPLRRQKFNHFPLKSWKGQAGNNMAVFWNLMFGRNAGARCFSGSFFKPSVDSSVLNIGIAMVFFGSVGLFWMYLTDVSFLWWWIIYRAFSLPGVAPSFFVALQLLSHTINNGQMMQVFLHNSSATVDEFNSTLSHNCYTWISTSPTNDCTSIWVIRVSIIMFWGNASK